MALTSRTSLVFQIRCPSCFRGSKRMISMTSCARRASISRVSDSSNGFHGVVILPSTRSWMASSMLSASFRTKLMFPHTGFRFSLSWGCCCCGFGCGFFLGLPQECGYGASIIGSGNGFFLGLPQGRGCGASGTGSLALSYGSSSSWISWSVSVIR